VSFLSIEELSSRGSLACREAFASLRDQLKLERNVEETVEYEPLKEIDAPSYNVRGTPELGFSSEKNWKYSCTFPRKLSET
jgi:hypothetical protein